MYKERYYRDDLENLSEEMLFEQLHLLTESGETTFCQCQICIQDIAAIALNNLPPSYISSFVEKHYRSEERNEKYASLRAQAKTELLAAIDLVSSRPHH